MARFSLLAAISLMCASGILASAQSGPPIEGPGSTLSQLPRVHATDTARLPYGLQLMARFDLLPKLRDSKCVQDSSYDRSGGNGDSGHFYKMNGNTAVLSDIKGPGCIYRFWSANAAGRLHIYLDGADQPVIDCPMQDLYLGKVAPFVAPLVGHKSGGWYCYFPIPFAKSCRIEVTDPGSMYYHVEYQLYPEGTDVKTFTATLSGEDQQALQKVVDQWNHLGSDPKPPTDIDQTANGTTAVAAGATIRLATLLGPAEIEKIHISALPANRYTLRQTLLRVYWDSGKRPAIEAPLGDFFGCGFGDQRFAALPDAMADDGYSAYWPMPFNKNARIDLVNTGTTPITDVHWTVGYRAAKSPLKNAGYFHAQWHRETTVAGTPFTILKVAGRGHYVGEHTDMQGDHGIGFLEGDEKIYRDGETFPSIYGTGTEDFYTGGWYFDEGPFNQAYHGCMLKDEQESRVAAYRYQIQDCVPFERDLNVTIQHGGVNDYAGADYSCVAYWYQTTPEHDWSPVDIAQLTPATMKIAGATEAEGLTWTAGSPEIRDDRALPEEASGGKIVVLKPGPNTFSFDVKTDDVYTVGLYQPVAPGTPRLGARWWLDDDALDAETLKSLMGDGNLEPEEHASAHTTKRLKPGTHTATVNVAAGADLLLDYIELFPSRKVKGAIEAESLVDKAVVSQRDTVRREDVSYDWSGGSALIWHPAAVGSTLKLPFTTTADGDYALNIADTPQPNGPLVTAKIDDGDPIGQAETYAPALEAAKVSVAMPMGRIVGLKAGAHTLTLTVKGENAAVKQAEFWLDYFTVKKSLYPNTVEAESLKVLDAKDGEATHQEMESFGKGWSNDDQFWLLGHKQNAEATLELPVAVAGTYELSVYYTTSRDYAIVQVLVDGKAIGAPTDTFTAAVLPKGKTILGNIDLTAGAHKITFRAVDKNIASTGYLIGVDAIGLTPVK